MLNNIIWFSVRNKFIIGLMTLALVVWGVRGATRLPIDAVPDITNNQVQIITNCPALAGQEVEQLVTFPIEQSLVNLPHLEETRSISRFGLSVITVVFKDDVDIYFARQLVNEKLKDAEKNIPASIGTPRLAPLSTGLGEVYQYILHPKKGSEHKYNAKDLRTIQDWVVARRLNGIAGVAEVNSFGGEQKQYEVAVNPHRLRAMGGSIPEIWKALEQNNQNTGGAYIDKKPNAYFIRGIGLATSLEDIRNIPLKMSGHTPVFIKDVADVRYGSAIRYGALTYNGQIEAVGGVVMMLKGQNSHTVVNRIKQELPSIQQSLPDDILIEPYLDRTALVNRVIRTIYQNLTEGALVVIFVLVVFLGNMRAGLIVASAIPLAMIFALGMMDVFGLTANVMSLGAIDFGLIVDGSVIVVEAILHRLNRYQTTAITQKQLDELVGRSTCQIRSTAAFGEIIILAVYIPILTLTGTEGKMFRPMAQTMSFAMFGALVLSLTYIPMMCSILLAKKRKTKSTISDRWTHTLQTTYAFLLHKAIRCKYGVIGTMVGGLAIALFLFSKIGSEFTPQLQEGDFAFHCILPQGSSLQQSIETSLQASRILKSFEEVNMVVGKTGSAETPTDPMPLEATDIMVILHPQHRWKTPKTYDELASEMLHKLAVLPGVFFEKSQPIQMRFNELMSGVRQDVAVKIFGENMDTLHTYATKIGQVIERVHGATAPQVEKVVGLPQIHIMYDRTRMANYGLTIQRVNDIVNTAFAGKPAGFIYENERRFAVVVRLDSTYRRNIEDVRNLMIPTPAGHQIPLWQVASVAYKLGAAQISRENGKRRITVGFNIAGRDLQSVVTDVQGSIAKAITLPTGYYITYGGQFATLQKATIRLTITVIVSVCLIFTLLYMSFRSVRQASLVFSAIPMSIIGGVFALVLRGMPFSISAGMGFIALFGVAVLNDILLLGTLNRLQKEGWDDVIKRTIEGTKTRLRPILATATVASLGFLPMAVSTGVGSEIQKPLATVVIGGLVSATFLTLFVLPLLYIITDSKRPNGSA